MQKTLKTRLIILFLTVVMCVGVMTPAHAYEMVYIQTSIDISEWEIVSSVIRANVEKSQHSPEYRRIPKDDLNTLVAAGNSVNEFSVIMKTLYDKLTKDENLEIEAGSDGINIFGYYEEEGRILSFPTNQVKRNDSTPEDYQEALKINNELVFGLNQAFNIYLGDNFVKTNDAGAYMEKMMEFLAQCGSSSNFEINDDECQFSYNGKTVSVKWKMENIFHGVRLFMRRSTIIVWKEKKQLMQLMQIMFTMIPILAHLQNISSASLLICWIASAELLTFGQWMT